RQRGSHLLRCRPEGGHLHRQLHPVGGLRPRPGLLMASGLSNLVLAVLVMGQPPEEPAPLGVTLARGSRRRTAPFDRASAFSERFRKRLNGGILSTVQIEMKLLDQEGGEVASSSRRCDLRLDIWDDVLLVRIQDADRTQRKRFIVLDEGLKACGLLDQIALTD